MANDLSKTRNDFQQYDLVTVFQASETRIMRHLHVATMAVVTKVDGDTLQCMPFPIREDTTANNIYAFNIGNVDYKVGDKVLVIFTDRDFRKNYDSATISERTIGKTNDAKLHSIDYGVVMPMAKAYEGSIEALKEKIDKHINDSANPHNVTKAQVGLENVVNQGMDVVPTKGSEKYISSGGVYDYVESFRADLNALAEAINQIGKDYATNDYVVGNFANKYDTNKAIESVPTKVTNNEAEIANIKNDYLTKTSADSTYAKSSDVNKSIDNVNSSIGKINTTIDGLNTSVADITKDVGDINTTLDNVNSSIGDINAILATKQDNLSFGNGLNNTDNLVTIDFTKIQAKVSADNGILFSNNVLSIDTSVIPTIEYLNSHGYAKTSDIPTKTSQLTNDSGYTTKSYVDTNFAKADVTYEAIDSLSKSTQSNASEIATIKKDYATNDYVNNTFANADTTNEAIGNLDTRITNAENNIDDRYTKADVDGFLTEKAKTCNTKDISYEEIVGNGGTYIGSSNQGPYKTGDSTSHENLIRVQNQSYGANYIFEMSHDFWENNGIHYRYKAEGGYSSWKTLIDSDNIGSQHVVEADHTSVADTFTATEIPHGDKFDGDLSSTTCSSAPMMMTTGKLTASSANEPSASKTTKTRDIRIGGTTKSITCPMNPFMEYFFDHGYHLDTVSTSSSYECDAGLVVYKEDLYYCIFSYKDSSANGFSAFPVSHGGDVSFMMSTQKASIAVEKANRGISFSYDEIKAVGSLYECLGEDKNKAYNVYLVLDSRPPIPLTFNEKSQDFLTADGDSCLDFPEMKGVLYETY